MKVFNMDMPDRENPASATRASAPSRSTAATIGLGTLAVMNVTAVVTLYGLPAEATYGLTSVFYYLFAGVAFAYIGPNHSWDQALAGNSLYMIAAVLIVFWAATFATLRGIKSAAATPNGAASSVSSFPLPS
jgi:hypothetical protein